MLTLRRAMLDDCRFFFDVANEPNVRAASFHPEPIDWGHHCQWFDDLLRNPLARSWVVSKDTQDVGVIRVERQKLSGQRAEETVVSIALLPEARGNGVGSRSLQLALEVTPKAWKPVVAYIKPDNLGSVKAFSKAGFWQTTPTDASLRFCAT